MSFIDELVEDEGCIDHLYLDSRGNTTCGVGQLIAKIGEVGRFTWTDFTAALQDFNKLQSSKRNCEYGLKWPASRYRPFMSARMTNPREGLLETIQSIDVQLARRLSWFGNNALPPSVGDALTDMAFNLGVDGLVRGYPKMLAAMAVGDWQTAAKESHRQGISDARNQRTYDRIMDAYRSVAGSSVRKP